MDRMSRLPDEILLRIFLLLPTKNAVSTSILSSRFSRIWTELPVIDLIDDNDHYCVTSGKNKYAFVNFLSNLLIVNKSPTILKFRLKQNFVFDRSYMARVNGWIHSLLSAKKVVELDLETQTEEYNTFCLHLVPCDSLQILKLSTNTDVLIPLDSGVCFPNLRIFHFSFYESPLCRELVAKLFPNLPLLEELVIRVGAHGEIRFNIVAPALRTFSIIREDTPSDFDEVMKVRVSIDAPLLRHICIEDDDVSYYALNNCPLISEAKINVGHNMDANYFVEPENYDPSPYISNMVMLLSGVANTKSLSLSGVAVLALAWSESNLPVFPNLTKLDLSMAYAPESKMLLPWLANAPNLEVLTVALREFEQKYVQDYASQESALIKGIRNKQIRQPAFMPTCMLFHLEEIEVRGFKTEEEHKMLKYIFNNARCLKKLIINGVRRYDIMLM